MARWEFDNPVDPKKSIIIELPDDLKQGTPEWTNAVNRKFQMQEYKDANPDASSMKAMGAAVSNAYEAATDPLRRGLATGLQAPVAAVQRIAGVPDPVPWIPERGGTAEKLAGLAIPPTLTEAAIMTGTAGAGPLARMAIGPITSRSVMAGVRTAGGMAGGALGGAATGEGAREGVLEGAAGAIAGELGGGIISASRGRLAKAAARRMQSDQDAVSWGSVLNDLVPLQKIDPTSPTGRGVGNLFSGVRDSGDLLELANRRGQFELAKSFDETMAHVTDFINAKVPGNMQQFRRPSDPNKFAYFKDAYDELKAMRYETYEKPKLSAINQKSFEANPAEDKAYRQAVMRMREELDLLDHVTGGQGKMLAMFDLAREQYEFGTTLLSIIRTGFKEGAETKNAKDIIFNARDVMAKVSDERGPLTTKLGDRAFEAIEYAASRATGKLGTVDVPHTGSLGAAGAVTLKGNITGGVTGLTEALKRDARVGEAVKLGLGPNAQTFADLVGQRSTGTYKNERPGGRKKRD